MEEMLLKFQEFRERSYLYKIPFALSLIGIVLIIGGIYMPDLFITKKPSPVKSSEFNQNSKVLAADISLIKVDVAGAVNQPGVYDIDKNSRVFDAVQKAGGYASGADQKYIARNINLSQKVADGQKIYIPFKGESIPTGTNNVSNPEKVGINTASISQLDSLSGVGEVTAKKIIANRPYLSLTDLIDKKVVSRTVYEKIKDQIDLN